MGAYFATPAFAKTTSSLPFSRVICAKSRIETDEVRHVARYPGDIPSDLFDGRRQLRLTAPRDEDAGAFVDKPLRRRNTDTAIATRHEHHSAFAPWCA
jgi:hypothetical protein